MPNSTLSFVSSSSFRDKLMAKNLSIYTVTGFNGVITKASPPLNYETTLTESVVVDSPNNLISNSPYPDTFYPLNEFGPSGGYDVSKSLIGGQLLPITPNQGEYSPNQSPLLLQSKLYIQLSVTSPTIQNIYIPLNGYKQVKNIVDIQNNNHFFLPYIFDKTLTPANFVSSIYTPYEVLTISNPVGDNGPVSNDSYLAKLAVKSLRGLLKKRIDDEIYRNTVGLVNLQSLSDPFEASLLAAGKEPLVYRNWRITVPEFPVTRAFDLATRLTGGYWPVSLIPGDYFDENTQAGLQTKQTSDALSVANQLTGGLLGPILNVRRNPSQIFLANTGNGQRSVLFRNLNFNRYQPGYLKQFGGILGVAQGVLNLLESVINPNGTLTGGYYVGNVNAEPSSITSPPNAIPVNNYGQQVNTPVYGPSELGILYEGNQNKLNFGLAGKPLSNGGGVDGGLVWVSPKYASNAGFHATPGGGSGSQDGEWREISSTYDRSKSTNIDFKENSILDNTQKLINSADNVSGLSKLKHVGNAINQVSKVFNDGYKEMTKGSMVLSYKDFTDGSTAGLEYCRVFTKDTPYYTFADLQKTDGITTSGRRFTNSVFDNTYNLNIAPLKGKDSTNIIPNDSSGKGGYAKKYMFSIENLAWRTSSRPGYRYDDLPVCEKGPNGGRVMWFPPYGLTFNDSSTADWNGTTFLGRPEPIYTYKSTSRTGSLSWKIIVDSPSVMNVIVEKQMKNASKERIDSVLSSFFAGCVKYDIYDLAVKFNTIPVSDLYTYQEILSDPQKTDEETLGQINNELPKGNSGNVGNPASSVETNNQTKEEGPDPSVKKFEDDYLDFAFYFENDIPYGNPKGGVKSTDNYEDLYSTYTGEVRKNEYKAKSESLFKNGNPEKNTNDFYANIIENNFKKFAMGDTNFITDAYDLMKKGNTIKLEMEGSASAIASVDYNQKLSERRIDTIKNFFKIKKIGEKGLGEFMEGDSPKFVVTAKKGTGEVTFLPKFSVEQGSGSSTATTINSGTGSDVDCTKNQKPDKPVKSGDKSAEIYSTSAMACRRVRVKNITVTPPKKDVTPKEDENKQLVPPPVSTSGNTLTTPIKKPTQEKTVKQRIKEGISKKILRNLLTECDYFEIIKESNPLIFETFKEKIKYFNPTFHSMTPEGLNSRLTFLNQCVRPGETIPVIGDKGSIKAPDAVNTSFGSAPVLILRIGDFFNTKIIPDSLSFTYDPLVFDMNPEGIGLQPMIANVTLSFKIIGGMGLKEPVEQLQNALSFNYYANTEIYDERATATEDTSAIDKMVVEKIVASQPPVTVNNVVNQETNDSASTIGELKTTVPVAGGETGELSYMKIMDKVYDVIKTYFTSSFNNLDEVRAKTNYGILQLVCSKRNFSKGTILSSLSDSAKIIGKPDHQELLDNLFEQVSTDIDKGSNPILKELNREKFTDDIVISVIKTNMKKYVDNLIGPMSTDIVDVVNKLSDSQQDYVQSLRKVNYVNTASDGKIDDNGTPKIYNLTGSLTELQGDYRKVTTGLNDFNALLVSKKILPPSPYPSDGNFESKSSGLVGVENKRFFMVIGRIFTDKNKVKDFITQILTPNIKDTKKPKKLSRVFENIVDDYVKIYKKEIEEEDKIFKTFKNSADYKKYIDGVDTILYKKGKPRIVTFTTVVDAATVDTKKTNLNSLYKGDPEKIPDLTTFDGKIKFN